MCTITKASFKSKIPPHKRSRFSSTTTRHSLHNFTTAPQMEKICVAVRLRPQVSTPPDCGFFWRVENNRVSLHKLHGSPVSSFSYAFDHVFDENSSNATVYELLTKDIIIAAVHGFNGTAFAYGQTSSGKTFTMNGLENDPGIIHRAVKDVFDKIEMISDREFLIRVSYMEIYNEEINDLFAVENQKLQIHESLERGIFVAGLREEIVNNAEQVLKFIESGEVNRHFGETNMNARSSRSHTIFRMVIESKGKETSNDAIRVSVLNLVDLAGSERIAKTGAGGVRLKEGKYINKSLMVLGNVINKLSDGAKQKGHIPYRDSKLTRILQPALGGNAKTSIICTLAPEEVHIEETKGTLQFASRAKRITNCAQVNEILTDAALLKRQKLEIEELRQKLQGSRSEVLEQEILKLRNDMLKYELEREKLEMELEEERRSQKEREQCIREQQLKIDNLSSLVTSTDSDRSCSQGKNFGEQGTTTKEDFNNSGDACQEDIFQTPTFKAGPNSFVVKRSNYIRMPDCSPLPDAFSNVADEDTWMKMNKGYIADLDSIQMTPARKVQSFPSGNATPGCSNKNNEQDVLNLRRQLELVAEEKKELEKKHIDQLRLNDNLTKKVSELKQEAGLLGKLPQRLRVSVVNCKQSFEEAMLNLQRLVPNGKSSTANLLNETTNIGITLFSNLEAYCSTARDSQGCTDPNDLAVQEHHKLISDNLKDAIASLASSEALAAQIKDKVAASTHTSGSCGDDSEQKSRPELDTLQEKYKRLDKELQQNSLLLEESREKYNTLERDFEILKVEKDSLLEALSKSSHKLRLVSDQKENVLRDLNSEAQRRKDLEEEIKQFSVAFSSRQRSLMSFHNEFRFRIEELRAENGDSVSKFLGS